MRFKLIVFILVLFISVTARAQAYNGFRDSLIRMIQINNYNKFVDKMKTGYWMEYTTRTETTHVLVYYVSSGLYFNNKKIGVWETKKMNQLLVQKEVYLDSSETLKIVYGFSEKFQLESEQCLFFDTQVKDTVYVLDTISNLITRQIVNGKYIRHGFYKEYWGNGKTKVLGFYSLGKKAGQWFEFDDKGNLIRREDQFHN